MKNKKNKQAEPVVWSTVAGDSMLIWQRTEESSGVGEPALAVRRYSDGIITIQQEDSRININRETLPALIQALGNLSALRG